MRWLALLAAFAQVACGAIAVDNIISWDHLSRGALPLSGENVLAPELDGGTLGTFTFWQYLSATNDVCKRWSVVPSAASYTVALTLGGANHTLNSGTNWLRSATGTNLGFEYLKLALPNATNWLLAAYVRVCSTNTTGTDCNLDLVQFASGSFSVFEVQVKNSGVSGTAHAQACDTSSSPRFGFGFDLGKVYFVLFHTDSIEGVTRVRVLDPASGYSLTGGADGVLCPYNGAQGWPMVLQSGYIESPVFPQGFIDWGPIALAKDVTGAAFTNLVSVLSGDQSPALPARIAATSIRYR
jgi:hypothetical protein